MPTPPGCPEADNEIAEPSEPVIAALMVSVPEVPLRTEIDGDEALSVKSPVAVEVTVSDTVVLSTVPSEPVPVTGIVNVPVEAFADAVNVSTELPFAAIGFTL